jgi:hypothetical protein
MTKKTRYFIVAAGTVLVVGLGGGLIAYFAYNRVAGMPAGVPPEMRYVPANASVVAFADVRAVMGSELRRSLMPSVDPESRKGRQMMNDFAGVDLEKQVTRVVAYVEPYNKAPDPQAQAESDITRVIVLVNVTFDPARIETFIRERAGTMDDYKGRKMFVHREHGHEAAVGLVGSDLIAMGPADLVRGIIDLSQGSGLANNITANPEMMALIRDNSGSTAWVVGQFDEIRRRMRLPSGVAQQVPPIRLVSVKANINGGVKATIRAEAGDKAAADQLRDVVRGFISLARLQGGAKPEIEGMLKSIELSGSDSSVRLSVALSPEALRAVAPGPRRRANPEPSGPQNPAPGK